jgi:amidase
VTPLELVEAAIDRPQPGPWIQAGIARELDRWSEVIGHPIGPRSDVTGQPAISLPLHSTGDGLPIGVQLVAGTAREDVLFRLSAQLERARPWSERRPSCHA